MKCNHPSLKMQAVLQQEVSVNDSQRDLSLQYNLPLLGVSFGCFIKPLKLLLKMLPCDKRERKKNFPIPIHHCLFHLSDLYLFQSKVKLILHTPHIFVNSFRKHLRLFFNIQNIKFHIFKRGFNSLTYPDISV